MPDTKVVRLNRISHSGIALQGELALAFAAVFIGVGTIAVVIGVRLWMLMGIGWEVIPFGLAGVAIGALALVFALRGRRAQARHERMKVERPDEPWMADHEWDPRGEKHNAWSEVGGRAVGLLVLALVLVPVHAWAVRNRELGAIFAAAVGDVVLGWLAWQVAQRVGRQLKYGRRSLRFETFPFFLGETLRVRFHASPSDPLSRVQRATATLRFIREAYETDKKNYQHVVCYQHWADTRELHRDQVSPTGEVPVLFELPTGDYETTLAARPPAYWEIELDVETPGLDLSSRFLVPVYPRPVRSGGGGAPRQSARKQ